MPRAKRFCDKFADWARVIEAMYISLRVKINFQVYIYPPGDMTCLHPLDVTYTQVYYIFLNVKFFIKL